MSIISQLFVNNPLYFSFFIPMVMDGITTLLGQEKSYWKDYKTVNEASPAYFVLIIHPFLFLAGGILWAIIMYLLIKSLNYPINIILGCLLISGHSWGSSSWITKILKKLNFLNPESRVSILLTWSILILYFLLIGITAGLSISYYFSKFYAN